MKAFALASIVVLGLFGNAHAEGYWYYCPDTKTYYPYVQSCASRWQEVVPGTQPVLPQAASPQPAPPKAPVATASPRPITPGPAQPSAPMAQPATTQPSLSPSPPESQAEAGTEAERNREYPWYVAHLGPEACVPLADIGPDGSRLYYGAGGMRSPSDFADAMRRTGMVITLDPRSDDNLVIYHAALADGTSTNFALIRTQEGCQMLMRNIEK